MTALASWMGLMKVGQMLKFILWGKRVESMEDPVKGTGNKDPA